jgi:para-aminobenzoate synthetase / 4-amino-4-deoxychorismate lyase
MRPPSRARLLRIPLEGDLPAHRASLLVRGDQRPFTLSGAWAGGGALVGSEPIVVAEPDEDPFEVVDKQPEVERGGEVDRGGAMERGGGMERGGAMERDADGAVGGGWFGFLGYGLGARLEPVPPSPPRPVPLPEFALAFYDHLLHLDVDGRWWFEALWTEARDAALRERRERLAGRLLAGVRERPVWVGTFRPAPPGAAGELAAVAACRERIAAGEIFQANLCLRLDSRFEGNPADLFARVTRELGPRHAAFAAGPWGAVCSLSPELFLRRRGREVLSEPIKGTAPRDDEGRLRLAASVKDHAENVMIVDLMRNDLGRVCEYGSVRVPELTAPRPAPGVWHLVSSVTGTLRPEVGDGELLRATFPAGSVTGAPKIQTMRVIAELEASGREAYTGAIGYASPVAGLELNVAIRTLEISGDRIWLGAGGGITSGSDPEAELEECMLKARPVIEAAGGRLADRRAPAAVATERAIRALGGGADRPDPALGVFSTMLVRRGRVVDLDAHLGRLRHSVRTLYGRELPRDLESRVLEAAAAAPLQRLRVLAVPHDGALGVTVEAGELPAEPDPDPVALVPASLPGGLGEHKWIDRRLLAELEDRLGGVPLLVDLDGEVLEAAFANVWIVEEQVLVTPPLDGRQLHGTVRAALLAAARDAFEVREEAITLERLAGADEILLSSAVRRIYPGTVAGRGGRFEIGAQLVAALEEREADAAARTRRGGRAVTR